LRAQPGISEAFYPALAITVRGHVSSLRDYMVQILKSRDFSVDERDGYIYGTRDDVSVVIMTAGDMLFDDVQDFVKNVGNFSGRKIVASLARRTTGFSPICRVKGCTTGAGRRSSTSRQPAAVHRRQLPRRSLIDDVISDETPQRLSEPPEQAIPVIVESAEEHSERIVKPHFSLDEVKYLARHEIQGYKYELELVPTICSISF